MSLILHCSDAHLDWRTHGVPRFDDVREALAQTVRVARAEKVDLWLFTGDLCDPDDGPAALRAVGAAVEIARELFDAGIASAWVAGNHDTIEDGLGRTTLTPIAALGGRVEVFDRPGVATLPGRPRARGGAPAFLVALPYPSLATAYDPAAFVRDRAAQIGRAAAVVATHLQLDGMHPGEESGEMARGRDVRLPVEEIPEDWLILAGHYHQGQTVERAGRKVHVVGSLARLTHGEELSAPRFVLYEV